MADIFNDNEYVIRRKVLTILGAKFHVYDTQERIVLFSQQKAFKLKEDIRIYSDESKEEERLIIQARQIIDFSAAYDVVDAQEHRKLGALRRKGWASFVRDSWEFLDENDRPIAKILEDSVVLALVRRFVTNLIPQTFRVTAGEKLLATYKQNFNPFVSKLRVVLEPAAREVLDPRMYLAAGILLAAIEGRQSG